MLKCWWYCVGDLCVDVEMLVVLVTYVIAFSSINHSSDCGLPADGKK